jgi:hypothetical protein
LVASALLSCGWAELTWASISGKRRLSVGPIVRRFCASLPAAERTTRKLPMSGDQRTAMAELEPPHVPRCFMSGEVLDFTKAHSHTDHGPIAAAHGKAYVAKISAANAAKDVDLEALATRCMGEGKLQEYAPGIVLHTLQYERGVCFHYTNKSSSKQLEETVQFQLVNMELLGKWKGGTTAEVFVPPGGMEVRTSRGLPN